MGRIQTWLQHCTAAYGERKSENYNNLCTDTKIRTGNHMNSSETQTLSHALEGYVIAQGET